MANLSKTLHINFYQNQSSFVEVTIKFFGVFMPQSVCQISGTFADDSVNAQIPLLRFVVDLLYNMEHNRSK